MKDAMKMLGVTMHYVSPYRPQSNGICERLNGTLINMLASYTRDNQNRWTHFIQMVVFAYNTSVHNATGYTPYFLVHGREASIGSDASLSLNAGAARGLPLYVREMQRDLAFAHQQISDRVVQAASDREKQNEQLKSLAVFHPGDQVYVYSPPKSNADHSRKLMSPYHGPYTVLKMLTRVTYHVQNNFTNKKTLAHVTAMKKVIPRPDHLLPPHQRAPAQVISDAVGDDPNHAAAEPAPDVLSRHTRHQHARRHQQQDKDAAEAAATAASPSPIPFAPASASASASASAAPSSYRFRSMPFGTTMSPAAFVASHRKSGAASNVNVDMENKYDEKEDSTTTPEDLPDIVPIPSSSRPPLLPQAHAVPASASSHVPVHVSLPTSGPIPEMEEDDEMGDDTEPPDEDDLEDGEVPMSMFRQPIPPTTASQQRR